MKERSEAAAREIVAYLNHRYGDPLYDTTLIERFAEIIEKNMQPQINIVDVAGTIDV